MPELKINISETTHKTLIALAETSGETLQTILEQAVENYRRSVFLMEANQAFTALRENETLWQEELAERQEWEQTLADNFVGWVEE